MKIIPFPPQTTKGKLLNLIRTVTRNKKFAVEQITEEAGNEILHLPPYHCQFNAIETVWIHAKRYYIEHTINTKDFSPKKWSNYIRYIVSEWKKLKVTRTVHPLVIDIENSSSSSEFRIWIAHL